MKAQGFFIAAVLIFTLSVLTLTLYNQVLNPNLYKNALVQSHIYEVTADILETEIAEAVVSWEKNALDSLIGATALGEKKVIEGSLNFVLGYVIEKQTPLLVESIFEKIQVATILQNIMEKAIDRDIAWLRGEREAGKVFEYIPTPEQIEELQGSELSDVIGAILEPKVEAVQEKILPVCATNTEVLENVQRLVQGDRQNITCTSERIRELEKDIINSEPVQETVGSVQSKVGEALASERVTHILTDIMGVSSALADMKQEMIDLRDTIRFIHSTAVFFVLVSIGLAIASIVYTSKNSRMRKFAIFMVVSGGLLFLYATIHYFVFSGMITRAIPSDQIAFGTKVLTPADGLMLTDSIRSIALYIAQGLVAQTFAIGTLLLTIGGLLWAILSTYKNRHKIAAKGRKMKAQMQETMKKG